MRRDPVQDGDTVVWAALQAAVICENSAIAPLMRGGRLAVAGAYPGRRNDRTRLNVVIGGRAGTIPPPRLSGGPQSSPVSPQAAAGKARTAA
jgi:hypothetical protein